MNRVNESRREALRLAVVGGTTLLGSTVLGVQTAVAGEQTLPPAFREHKPKALPFPAGKLKGLSEKLIASHYENNYGGAVKNLNRVEKELAQLTKDSPPFVAAGLAQSALTYRNSMVLHEAYFGNLGGNGKPQGKIEKALSEAYGSLAKWEEHFRLIGTGLGGGSGWVVLAYDLREQQLLTHWSGHHTQVGALTAPLLVMDLYEHSYQMDYGAAVAKYIEVFFQNIQWEEIERRYESAQKGKLV